MRIGHCYARADELGVPFAVTVDFETLKEPHSVTLRDRDSMLQVRLPVNEVAAVIKNLACGKLSWTELRAKYPAFI
jgi:glycyl-tRNA synthetase